MMATVVWIDHAGARIATCSLAGETEFRSIESGVEKRHRTFGQSGAPLPGHIGGNPESHYQNRRRQELNRYYSRVTSSLRGTDTVLVLGPERARREFLKHLQESGIQVVRAEAAPKLSDQQMLERLRELPLLATD